MKTDKELYEFCKGHYYCVDCDDDTESKWQPFENWSDAELEEHIEFDVRALKLFLKNKSDTFEAIKEALINARLWHNGDKWRSAKNHERSDAWKIQSNLINEALKKAGV